MFNIIFIDNFIIIFSIFGYLYFIERRMLIMDYSRVVSEKQGPLKRLATVKNAAALLAFTSAAFFFASRNRLLFNSIIELLCILLYCNLFKLALNSYSISKKDIFMLWGILCAFTGLFTAFHALSYYGTGIMAINDTEISAQFGLIAMYMDCISTAILLFSHSKKANIKSIAFIYMSVSIVLIFLVFRTSVFSPFFSAYGRPTPAGSAAFSTAALATFFNIVFVYRKKEKIPSYIYRNIISILVCSGLWKAMFLFYGKMYGTGYVMGHVFKFLSFYIMYKTVEKECIGVKYSRHIVENEAVNDNFTNQDMNNGMNEKNTGYGKVMEELGLQRTYFKKLFDCSPEGMVITDNEGKILDINKGFQDIFQYNIEEIKGRSICDVIVPENCYGESVNYINTMQNNKLVQAETMRRKKGGKLIWVSIIGYAIEIDKDQVGMIGIYRDISEHKKVEEEIRYLSFHDKLTGLYNRAFFDEELKRLDTGRQLPLSIIMGDANNLKLANDVFGHVEGDRLLVCIADIFRSCCREEDIIARWGGDEFLILLPNTNEKTAGEICNRIRKSCRKVSDLPIQPSIALGVSTKTKPSQSIQRVLMETERKMYKNKLSEHGDTRHTMMLSLERFVDERNFKNRAQTRYLKSLSSTIKRPSKPLKMGIKKP